MELVLSIIRETSRELLHRHYITASELARAAYLLAYIKTDDFGFISDVASIDRFCMLGKFEYAERTCAIVLDKYSDKLI